MKKFLYLLLLGSLSLSFVLEKNPTNDETTLAEGGIKFEQISLEEAMKLSKSTGKTIFIDAYTEWCGPCKRMAATSFMDAEVAKLFNSKFINLKIEVEKSADGPTIAKMFGIRAYPTLLFIDGEGKLKKSLVGLQTAEQLLAIGKSL
jgi:thioredoxin 1